MEADKTPCLKLQTSTEPLVDSAIAIKRLQNALDDVLANEAFVTGCADRETLLSSLSRLIGELEDPDVVAFRQAFESHTHNLCLRLGIDLGIFRHLSDRAGEQHSLEILAHESGADKDFVARILRVIAATGYVTEVGGQTYMANRLTRAMAKPAIEACLRHSFDVTARVQSYMPAYFKLNRYQNPRAGTNGPFQFAFQTHLTFFEYLHADPVRMKTFNTYMTGNRGRRKNWIEWYPLESQLQAWATSGKDHMFLVDIGGGRGRDLERLLAQYPEVVGKVALQELPGTVETLDDFHGRIIPIACDMFQEQRVKGAMIYYTHFLLHDFTDEDCRRMLKHVASAMVVGRSRLLLNEIVLPDQACPSFFAAADIAMMTGLAALCRSGEDWISLMHSVGLDVVKIYNSPDSTDMEAIIEVMLPFEASP